MFQFEVNNAIIVEQQQALKAALSTSPKAANTLRRIIRKYIAQARNEVVRGMHFKNGDPREAARAVRRAVYKKVFGGNLNIYNSRRAHGTNNYEPPRTLRPGQRGGNRMKRSSETQRMMSYAGPDRGMVLRWVNSGTGTRTSRCGNRGRVEPTGMFTSLGNAALMRMSNNIVSVIEKEMTKLLNKENNG